MFASAVVWVSGLWYFLGKQGIAYDFLMAFVMGGMASGAITTLSSERITAITYVLITLGGTALWLLISPHGIEVMMGVMVVIYVGGILTPSLIYFAHDIYHVMTHTVYQHFLHQYQHFKGIAHDHSAFAGSHGHTHNGFIDFALHQIDDDKSRQQDRNAPMTLTTFKYTEHVKSGAIIPVKRYFFKKSYITFDVLARGLSDPEPFTPPPKVL